MIRALLPVALLALIAAGVLVALALGVRWLWQRIKTARWNRFRRELTVARGPWEYSERERDSHRPSRNGGKVA